MRIKIEINHLVIDLLMLLPVATLFQGFFPAINRLILVAAILALCISVLHKRFNLIELIMLLLAVVVCIIAIFNTPGIAENINEYVYFPFFVLYCFFMSKNRYFLIQYSTEKKKYMQRIVLIWNICVIISTIFPNSFSNGYFVSFTGNTFRCSTAATFILSLILMILRFNKKFILHACVPMFCILFGGSRTYLVVALAIFLMMYYTISPTNTFFLLSLIPFLGVVLVIVSRSGIMKEVVDSVTVLPTDFYQDILVKFTSGRSLFWKADLEAFCDGNLFNKLFGFGYNYVYDVNEMAIGARIWAHSDFINILLNYGIAGLTCYLVLFHRMFFLYVKNCEIPKWFVIVLWGIWMFNAFFNMFYTYTCACVSYPFLLVSALTLKKADRVHNGFVPPLHMRYFNTI